MSRIWLVSDMSTVQVERFFSSLTQFLSNSDRAAASYEFIEDLLRCHFNGPPMAGSKQVITFMLGCIISNTKSSDPRRTVSSKTLKSPTQKKEKSRVLR